MNHPARFFSELMEKTGPSIFVIWKHALLNKRILFSAKPPLETLCGYVYCTCLMASFADDIFAKQRNPPDLIQPMFCVGVNDITKLSMMEGYAACTSDRIFEEKKELYEVYVGSEILPSKRNRPPQVVLKVIPSNPPQPDSGLTLVNSVDKRRWRDLAELFPSLPVQPGIWDILEQWWTSKSSSESRKRASLQVDPTTALGGDSSTLNVTAVMTNEQVSDLLEPLFQERDFAATKFEGSQMDAELVSYFQALNTTILRHLRLLLGELEVEKDGTFHLQPHHLEELGLHPKEDAQFVERLCSIYFPEFGDVVVIPEPTLTERLLQKVQSFQDAQPTAYAQQQAQSTEKLLMGKESERFLPSSSPNLSEKGEKSGKNRKSRRSLRTTMAKFSNKAKSVDCDDDWDSDL